MEETLTLTLTRSEAVQIADRIRDLHHNAFPPAVEAWTAAQTEYWALIREACA